MRPGSSTTEASETEAVETLVTPRAEVCRAIELIEAASAVSQHRCAAAPTRKRLGLESERFGAATLVVTRKSENLHFNRVIGLGQRSPATARGVERVLAAARTLGAPRLAVVLTPRSRPQALARWLEERGLERGGPGAKLWRGDEPLPRLPSSGVSVRRVRPAEAGKWVDLVAQVWLTYRSRRDWYEARFATPGWTHYLAWDGETPVGAGAMFVGEVGGLRLGHLVDGVTLPGARRRGVQTAIIRRRVRDGLRSGCRFFCSETAPPLPRMPLVSYRNLCRQGFRLAYLRHSWSAHLG